MTIYLCGPISLGGTVSLAQQLVYRNKFSSEETRLLSSQKKYMIRNPCNIIIEHGTWENYMRACLIELMKSNMVAVLPDAEKSKGASLEIMLAHMLKIPVKKVEEIV